MKKLLGILVLIFTLQTPSLADDIRDFQIEGMSVGDSALDYFSKKKIDSSYKGFYAKSKKFFYIIIENTKFDLYDNIDFYLKADDKNYKMYGIAGIKRYKLNSEESYKKCISKKEEIESYLEKIFPGSEINKSTWTNSNGSKSIMTDFELDNGVATIRCIIPKISPRGTHITMISLRLRELAEWHRYAN